MMIVIQLEFAGGLTFSHIKYRDSALIIFREIEAPLSEEFRTEHPNVQVVFYSEPELDGEPYTVVDLPIL